MYYSEKQTKIRETLGQNMEIRPEHLRFNFDARDDYDDNKKIIDLFEWHNVVIYSRKGGLWVYIHNEDPDEIDMWKYIHNMYNTFFDNSIHPCVQLAFSGEGTCEILEIIQTVRYHISVNPCHIPS